MCEVERFLLFKIIIFLPLKNLSKTTLLDVSGISEKLNIGIYRGTKDNIFCIFIGPDLHSYTKFPLIRENDSTLIPFLLEEFGSSTILAHLFRNRLL